LFYQKWFDLMLFLANFVVSLLNVFFSITLSNVGTSYSIGLVWVFFFAYFWSGSEKCIVLFDKSD
jgi:hypothetical protein